MKRGLKVIKNTKKQTQSIIKWSSIVTLSFVLLILSLSPINIWGFGGVQHNGITQDGLPFLNDDILSNVMAGNLHEDTFPAGWQAKNHFDACDFTDSVKNIGDKYDSIIDATSPGKSPFSVAYTFGKLLHPVQDFYSHTNWAELGELTIADSEVGRHFVQPWESIPGHENVRVVQNEVPSEWSMTRSLVPVITEKATGNFIGNGLFSHGRWSGDDCPEELEDLNHDQLNKDDPNPDDYAGPSNTYNSMFLRAKYMGLSQTSHEFCRYLHLLNTTGGFEKASIPMGLWVDKSNYYYAIDSPCRAEPGNASVTVRVSPDQISVLDDLDDGDNPGDLNLAFVLYKDDFRIRAANAPVHATVQSPDYWPEDRLPSSLTMCLNSSDTVVATVQGWDDEEGGPAFERKFNDLHWGPDDIFGNPTILAAEDQTLEGVTLAIPASSAPTGQSVSSEDIMVNFTISSTPGCHGGGDVGAAGGGGGGVSGGYMKNDSDFDKIANSVDNCPSFPNPSQENSDEEGEGDACDGMVFGSYGMPMLNDRIDFNDDGVVDTRDTCPYTAAPENSYIDRDNDTVADTCYPYGIAGTTGGDY